MAYCVFNPILHLSYHINDHLPTSSTATATISASRGGGVGVFGLDLVLLLVVEKITSRSIDTIA